VTTGPQVPSEAVATWLDAVENLDVATLSSVVVPESLVLVLAMENAVSPEETALLLQNGLSDDLQEQYWRSFRDEFAGFAGRPISTLTVGDAKTFEAEGHTYAAVDVFGTGNAGSVVIVRREDDGSWAVDPLATLAPGFVVSLRREFDAVPPTQAGEAIVAAYRTSVVPSLWAALGSGAFDDAFAREALALIEAVGASGA